MRSCLLFLIPFFPGFEANGDLINSTVIRWIDLSEGLDFNFTSENTITGLDLFIYVEQTRNYSVVFDSLDMKCKFEIDRIQVDVNSDGVIVIIRSPDLKEDVRQSIRGNQETNIIHLHWDREGLQFLSFPLTQIRLMKHCVLEDVKSINGSITALNVPKAFIDLDYSANDSLIARIREKDKKLESDIDALMSRNITLAIILSAIHLLFLIALVVLIVFTRLLMKHKLKIRWKSIRLDDLYVVVMSAAVEAGISDLPKFEKDAPPSPPKIMINVRKDFEKKKDVAPANPSDKTTPQVTTEKKYN
ncbi:unnamed protein product [Bursaphelenchus xylophilus]|uniref:(pine wood nematode) hypothetical protein n=1 Tax=Bursaphelenchus xylophilus TaxID=6326 RepID=A0A1I7RLK4_BURXY|nr:unnamed protein product [Bursaphelenchus xylophilus]CAG9082893.1 unnamed protein product [Bursaphelenchus xylophilus]